MEDHTKLCSRCGQSKPLDEFYMDRRRDRPGSYCKTCAAAYRRGRHVPKEFAHEVRCLQCGEPLDLTARTSKARKFCSKICGVRWHTQRQTREYRRDSFLRSTFGITLAEYNERLATQGGCCLLCLTPEAESRHGVLDVDHDHKSGYVRGLLCHQCNWALGILGDDPALLRRAAEYLEASASV
jgi:hypothetical protein